MPFDFSSLITVVLIVATLASFAIAWRNAAIRRANKRAADAARAAERLEAMRPAGLGAYEGADPQGLAWAARREIMRVLARAPHSAYIDGERVDAPALIAALSAMRYPATAHAQPLAPLKAAIATAAGQITLWLERDGDSPRDYWVFHPGLEATRAAALGLISTELLDRFEPETQAAP
jgi:hypothetical protein